MDKTPQELAQERLALSEEFSRYSGELARLIKTEAEFYNTHRPDYKSDTAVKRAFTVTDDGVKMNFIKLKLTSIKMSMSAIKSLLETLTEQARGLY